MENIICNFNNIINKFYLSIKSDGNKIISNISDIDDNIFKRQPLKLLYSENSIKILIILIHAIISAVILYYAFKCILSLYSSASIQNIYLFIIKLIIITIFSSNSFYICKEIVNFNYMISVYTEEFLEEISSEKIDYSFLEDNISTLDDFFKSLDKVGINGFKDLIICSYIIYSIIFLSIRYVVVILCIIFSPFTIISLISYKTKFIFEYWIKLFAISLGIQIINKIIIFIPIVSKDEKDFYIATLLGSIFVLYKINKSIGDIKIYGKNK